MKSLEFNGKGLEYFKIWIVNIMLTIVTLGIYYPWAKVRNMRYFYGNTGIENRTFDYHATGKQLFVGYLIAVAALIVYVIAQNISPATSGIVFLIFFITLPWIIWRSLRFNMRMTSFSNVRLGFNGNLGSSYMNFLLLPILCFVVLYSFPIAAALGTRFLGINPVIFAILSPLYVALIVYLFAYMKKRNASYTVNGLTYGQGQFSANLKTKAFVKISLKTFAIFAVSILCLMILATGIIAIAPGMADSLTSISKNPQDSEQFMSLMQSGGFTIIFAVYLGFIAMALVTFAYSYSRRRAYIYKNTKLDGQILFKSTLKARSLAWVTISNLLIIIITLGLGAAWAKVRTAKLIVENTHIKASSGFEQYITKQEEYQSSIGDQLGEIFDVDVGIGI